MITIIIPTYKPEKYIYECLSSIKNQDIENKKYNVIIVLNGEKEPYYSYISDFIKSFLNFKLYHISQKGVSNARNYALDMIKEGYVAFIDDDDKISTNYLSGLLIKIDNSSVCISNERSFYNGDSFFHKGYLAKKFEKLKTKQKKSMVLCRSFFSTACFKLLPINIIGTRRFNTNFSIGEDALFMALISDKIKSIKFANEDVIYYRRIRENSASRKKRSFFSKLKNAINLVIAYCNIYISSPLKYNILFFITRLLAVLRNIKKKSF
jgi:glycosyltransferase involved in cell wall biosynthesis